MVPDRLSRRADYLASMSDSSRNVTSVHSSFLDQLRASQEADTSMAPMWQQARSADPNF